MFFATFLIWSFEIYLRYTVNKTCLRAFGISQPIKSSFEHERHKKSPKINSTAQAALMDYSLRLSNILESWMFKLQTKAKDSLWISRASKNKEKRKHSKYYGSKMLLVPQYPLE